MKRSSTVNNPFKFNRIPDSVTEERKTYMGNRCKRGHSGERYEGGSCVACQKIKNSLGNDYTGTLADAIDGVVRRINTRKSIEIHQHRNDFEPQEEMHGSIFDLLQ